MRAMLPGFQAAGVDVVLLYSVRSPAEAAFGAEFAAAAAAGGVRVIYTVTGAQAPNAARVFEVLEMTACLGGEHANSLLCRRLHCPPTKLINVIRH